METALSSCQMEPSGPRLGAASSKPAHPALGLRTELGTRFLQQWLALGTDGRLHPPLGRVPNLAAHQNHLGWLRGEEILEDAGSWPLPPPHHSPTEYSLHRWNPGSLIFESFFQILMSSLGSVGLLSPEKVNSGNTLAPQTFPSPQTLPSERPVSIALPTQA